LPNFDFSHVPELKQLSYKTYGRAREEVEAEIRQRFGQSVRLVEQGLPSPYFQ
jgi:hypothetical protein